MTAIREVPAVFRRDRPPPGAAPPGGDSGTPRRRRRLVRLLVGLLVVGLLLGVGVIGAALMMQSRLDGQVDRIDGVFEGLEDRPTKPGSGPASRAVNILLMGTDRRAEGRTTGSDAAEPSWVPGAQRTDTIMLLHVNGDRDGASLISIPRDSWVDVPGHGPAKVNAAFSLAGPSLAVATIEELTGVRIDHLAVVDWTGYKELIDSVGGVQVNVPMTVEDPHNKVLWVKGRQTLDGELALLYVRQRYGLRLGDLDRVRRQQAVVRALMNQSLGTLRSADPRAIYDLLDTLTRNISVDAEWSIGEMRDLLLDLRSTSVSDIDFFTVPVAGFGDEGGQSVVYLDEAGATSLWESVRQDRVATWRDANDPAALTGNVP